MVGNVLEYEEMNDILAKLYIQAAEMAVKEEPTDLIAGQIVQMQKFAELIVRECIGCCEQVISDPVPESVDTWLNGGEQCIQEIKEHFGLGMSVEDKKQLIKDLLGVSNDTKS
jgi:hypothetical protein